MATSKLKSMQYKSFTWSNNPAECKWECDRAFAKHKYPEITGTDLEDFSPNAVVISGSGEFFGTNAYKTWRALVKQFNTGGSGKFFHPVFTDVNVALMTKLSASLEPRPNYVAYTFEIIADRNKSVTGYKIVSNIVEQVIRQSSSTGSSGSSSGGSSGSSSSSSSNEFKVGDKVIVNGTAYKSPNGDGYNTGDVKLITNQQMVITDISSSGTTPYHVGSAIVGWVSKSSIKKYTSSASVSPSSGTVHIVKAGETLSGICARYGISDWKSVASANGIKDPSSIKVGQKIIISSSVTITSRANIGGNSYSQLN